ncbi:MAG: hypothetical protein LRZ84_05390 [Desertifilum sp.]|nr:hypothetical protein [Desertifilum sp.]
MPELYASGGANGSGKTTVSLSLLPSLRVRFGINANAIAAGLSPFNPDSMAMQAGRLMLVGCCLDSTQSLEQDSPRTTSEICSHLP